MKVQFVRLFLKPLIVVLAHLDNSVASWRCVLWPFVPWPFVSVAFCLVAFCPVAFCSVPRLYPQFKMHLQCFTSPQLYTCMEALCFCIYIVRPVFRHVSNMFLSLRNNTQRISLIITRNRLNDYIYILGETGTGTNKAAGYKRKFE